MGARGGAVGVAVAIVVLSLAMFGGSTRRPRHAPSTMVHTLAALPPAAVGPIAGALARRDHRYQVRGLRAGNPVQRLTAAFTRAGATVTGPGGSRVALSLQAFGRGRTLAPLATVAPATARNRVEYRYGRLREWFVNGPLGFEQGFEIPRAPAVGAGALKLSIALGGNVAANLHNGTVALTHPGAAPLQYAGLIATDAGGRTLRSQLELAPGRIVIAVQDRGARYPVRIDPFVQQAKLTPAAGTGAEVGLRVAVSGNTVVVAAPFSSTPQTVGGAAYVFVKPSSGWASTTTPTATLTCSCAAANEIFGSGVAIEGSTIVVGDQGHTTGTGGVSGGEGAAFVFTKPSSGGWKSTSTPNAQLEAAQGAPSDFGDAVAISGGTIVVGAPSMAVNFTDQGEAYLFKAPAGGWSGTLTESADLIASDGGVLDSLGSSVALSGSTVLAGAPASAGGSGGVGRVYIFDGTQTGIVSQYAELTDGSGPSYDEFGVSVASTGTTIFVGALGVRISGNTSQGAVFIFKHPTTGGWVSTTPDARLTAADGTANDFFGASLAASGPRLVVGAPDKTWSSSSQGAVYVYAMPACGWVSSNVSQAEFADPGASGFPGNDGWSVGISGATIVAGAPLQSDGSDGHAGTAYVYGPAAGSVDPTITSISPTSGVDGSTTVAITGTNLAGATSVCLGNKPAQVTYDSPTLVRAVVPNGARSGQISVQTAAGTATAPQSFKVTLGVFGMQPATGPAGTKVIISGVGFTAGSTVKFNGTPATIVKRNLPSSLTAVVPLAAASGRLTVTNTTAPVGTTSSAATFIVTAHSPPAISSFTPTTGITGSQVTISGNFFTAATSVKFGSRPATFTVVSATQIKATVPDGDTPSTITVTTPVGSATTTSKFNPTLSITSFSPSNGAPGTQVTINGIGFTSGTVKFNGTPAGSAISATPTQIVIAVPPGATTGKITIVQTSAPTGTVQSATSFTVP